MNLDLDSRTVDSERIPGWILAVLPRFRFSFILLLIESRRWAAACVSLVVGMPTPESLHTGGMV